MNEEGMAITKDFGLEPWRQEYLQWELMSPSWMKSSRDVAKSADKPEWVKPENMAPEYVAGANLLYMRYITEDLPYGLVTISELGKMVKVPTPTIDSVITIGSIISEADYQRTGRTLEKLGIAGMSESKLLGYLNEGVS